MSITRNKVAVLRYKLTIMINKSAVAIKSYLQEFSKFALLRISHSCKIQIESQEIKLQLWGINSQLWEIKLQFWDINAKLINKVAIRRYKHNYEK